METHVARCVACRAEFTEAEIAGASACPRCGRTGVPSDPRRDVQITINPHELRILTIWATNWANENAPDAQAALRGIVGALASQESLQGVPLTLAAEFQRTADATGSPVEVTRAGPLAEPRVYRPKKPD